MGDNEVKPPATITVATDAPYPSNQKRIVVMLALYLTVFLVTLVQPDPALYTRSIVSLTQFAGPKYHFNCDSSDHRRIPFTE